MDFGSPKAETEYQVECWSHWYTLFGFKIMKRQRPKLRWRTKFKNLVVTTGLNKLLDATFKTGGTPAWYVGLKSTGTPLAADTMSSHSSWTELVPFSNSVRPTFTPGSISAGSVDNSASKAVFNINATSTIFGCFMTTDNTVSGTAGTLYGVGDFGASRAVVNGDTLNVTITLTQT